MHFALLDYCSIISIMHLFNDRVNIIFAFITSTIFLSCIVKCFSFTVNENKEVQVFPSPFSHAKKRSHSNQSYKI